MADLPVWPTGLPLIDFSRKPKAPFVRTDMDGGLARQRRRFRVYPVTVNVNFFMDQEKYDLYHNFCEVDLGGYSSWFSMRIDGASGVDSRRVRWLDTPNEQRIPGNGFWQISGQVETLSNY